MFHSIFHLMKAFTVCLLVPSVVVATAAEAAERFDIVLTGGRIVDGSGAPWYRADIGIRGTKIVHIGRIDPAAAERTIDVSGLIVAPGFIDMMGQTATPLLENPEAALNLLTQGITTINAGEGVSAAPVSEASARTLGWRTMAEYFQLLELKGLPVNVVQTVGHTQVRRLVLGDVDRRPTEDELGRMKALVQEAMEAGAIGVSTALIYPPAVYATTEEIAELAKVAGAHGGRYFTHMRNEGDRLLEAIDEALEIGEAAGTPVHIFHLKAAGRHNWGKIEQAIARIKAARAAGRQVTADIYPYIHNGLGLAAFIHPRHFAQGDAQLWKRLGDPELRAQVRREMESETGWENWYRHTGSDWNKVILGAIPHKDYAEFAGQSLGAISKARGEDSWNTFFNLVSSGVFALPETMTEANVIRLIQQEFVSFCTDVGPAIVVGSLRQPNRSRSERTTITAASRIASHPRACGAFPRLLGRYVRDLGAVSLERAVAQASAAAANDVLAYDRGRIAVGLAADLIAFDYEKLTDLATFAEPNAVAEGMRYVLVNGEIVLEEGKLTGKRPGRVLRGPGYRADRAPAAASTGQTDPRLQGFDRLMASFLEEHRVPGAALAVTHRGRLVHARGYGYADLAAREPVTPTSLFRIASISKPITAAAIMRLVEQGKLTLDDCFLDYVKYEPHLEEGANFDERQRKITIRHLLEHRGGWDRDKSFDAMFQSVRFAKSLGVAPPAAFEHVIRCMHGQPLDFEPGERYAYSNYGYCLLGRVIETVTGQEYESYVQQQVLKPLGIHAMRIGKTRLEDRCLPAEVRYYEPARGPSVFTDDLDQTVPWPYGAWHLEAMDSHGGWIASAVDLARFAAAFDDPKTCPILNEKGVRTLFERPPGLAGYDAEGKPLDVYYSLGWMNRTLSEPGKFHSWHTGSLAGTATLLIRRADGRNMVVLFNCRSNGAAPHLGRTIDPLLHKAVDAVQSWPEVDLFTEHRSESP